ncbi:MAG: OmpA family protein [Granulosicoccaceae bacterium]
MTNNDFEIMHLLPVAVISALLALVLWWGVSETPDIEQDIAQRASAVIQETSPDARVEVNGRDVRVFGETENEELRRKAGGAADEVWGVRASRNDIRVAALKVEEEPEVVDNGFDFTASYDSEKLTMSGRVDTVAAANMLEAMPERLPPGLEFENGVETGSDVLIFSPEKLETGIATLTQLKRGDLKIDDEVFSLSGIADNQTRIDQIRKQISTSKAILEPLKVLLNVEVDPNKRLSAECKAKFGTAMKNNVVHYVTAKHNIREQYIKNLEMIAKTAVECDARVLIEGHADEVGKENYNQGLSVRRATTAREFLIDKGVPESRIEAFGYGEFRPVASNETPEGKAKNRRVEIHIQHITE